jgi:uncharacterized membrane protein YbhN (UPF0104 family)
VQDRSMASPASCTFLQGTKKWRPMLSRLLTVCMIAILVYWGWHHRLTLQQVFVDLALFELTGLCLLLTLGIILSAWGFTMLVRSMGYPFTYQDGYHSLNLSQIAAMLPGKIWGFTGLVALLWSRGVSKSDSVLIIFLYTLLTLSAAVLVGMLGFIPTIGWGYTLLCLMPMLLLLTSRSWFDALRSRYFRHSSTLPSTLSLLSVLIIGLGGWIIVSGCFALLVSGTESPEAVSPLLIASAFAAGYVGGYISPLTPAGLGVREGIIAVILGSSLGSDRALAAALVFRVLHMAVLWLHIAITLCVLSLGGHEARKGLCGADSTAHNSRPNLNRV